MGQAQQEIARQIFGELQDEARAYAVDCAEDQDQSRPGAAGDRRGARGGRAVRAGQAWPAGARGPAQ